MLDFQSLFFVFLNEISQEKLSWHIQFQKKILSSFFSLFMGDYVAP